MHERSSDLTSTVLLPATLAASLAGGVLLLVSEVASLATGFVAVGSALFVVGLVLAVVIGFRDARRSGTGVARSIARGLVAMWRWLWDIMP